MSHIIPNRAQCVARFGFALLISLAASIRFSGTIGAIEIIAHRGASDSAPENTLAAVNTAWAQGADAVEVDIHLTADGRIVVIHDPTTTRTTGVVGHVAQLTLEGLRCLRILDPRTPDPEGEKIPTLAEVLDTLPEGKRIYIEIKCGSEIVPELIRVIHASGKDPAQMAAITWRFNTARQVKCCMPNIAVYMLRPAIVDPCRRPNRQVRRLNRLILKCYQAGLDGLDIDHRRILTAASVQYAHQLGLTISAWTVNSIQEAWRLQSIGVDGITTDRPLLMRQQLGLASQ
ncbi:MAG: hypothetical protein JW829_07770 [Pirellulales bacterium]|nr:hypothetical protein [Pirellulales bacterium]